MDLRAALKMKCPVLGAQKDASVKSNLQGLFQVRTGKFKDSVFRTLVRANQRRFNLRRSRQSQAAYQIEQIKNSVAFIQTSNALFSGV